MAERLRFQRERRFAGSGGDRATRARVGAMGAVLLVCAGMFAARAYLLPAPAPAPSAPVVEVRGDVPRPGLYEAATVHDALRLAGADPAGQADATLAEGTRLVIEEGALRLERMGELVFGLPIDVNTASAEALQAIPGVGEKTAASILADRDANGPFTSVEDLDRVRGIGPATVEKLRPFVTVGAAAP